jgi:methionyl-tRNA formyltransferase
MCADPFLDKSAIFCVAGKNDIAVRCLGHLLELGLEPARLRVVLNKDDTGRSTWQHSLGFHARRAGVKICALDELKPLAKLWFFSVEFDRIIRPQEFATDRLFNVHFSKLPAYRGVATSVWPILRGEPESGVTFHEIDAGVDTGPIYHQRVFPIGPDWTARDLYFRYLDDGFWLFCESLSILRGGDAVPLPQDESRASLYRRRDLDFKRLVVDLTLPAGQVHDQIRAYSFWEYQLPLVAGRKVWSSRRLPGPAGCPPGTLRAIDPCRSVLSASGGDLEIWFSPYDELYDWANGASAMPDLSQMPDLELEDAQGWSAMMKAAHSGNTSALRALAFAGASPIRANRRGTTPLMYAFTRMIERQDPLPFRLLLELGADPFARDQHERSILDYAPAKELPKLRSEFPAIFR